MAIEETATYTPEQIDKMYANISSNTSSSSNYGDYGGPFEELIILFQLLVTLITAFGTLTKNAFGVGLGYRTLQNLFSEFLAISLQNILNINTANLSPEQLKELLEKNRPVLRYISDTVIEEVINNFTKLALGLSETFKLLVTEWVKNILPGLMKSALLGSSSAIEAAIPPVGEAVEVITTILSVLGAVAKIFNGISTNFDHFSNIYSTLSNTFDKLQEMRRKVQSLIVTNLGVGMNALQNAPTIDAFNSALTNASRAPISLGTVTGVETARNIRNAVGTAVGKARNMAGNMRNVAGNVRNMAGNVAGNVRNMAGNVRNMAGNVENALRGNQNQYQNPPAYAPSAYASPVPSAPPYEPSAPPYEPSAPPLIYKPSPAAYAPSAPQAYASAPQAYAPSPAAYVPTPFSPSTYVPSNYSSSTSTNKKKNNDDDARWGGGSGKNRRITNKSKKKYSNYKKWNVYMKNLRKKTMRKENNLRRSIRMLKNI